jgi:ABC-type branched-subunit amino acid transport system ATPase component
MATAQGLVVDGVSVSYGGPLAVDSLALHAPRGRITGLIGPNGAGKTTLFNACTGRVRTSAGRVTLDADDVTSLSPSARARGGLARTFQHMELFEDLSVVQNVAMGREAALAGRSVRKHLFASRADREMIARVTEDAVSACGLSRLVNEPVWKLSTGQRRLVELARALASSFSILMLDEPSSGLDAVETTHLGDVLMATMAARDVGIVLVEHDMALVMRVCTYIYVLDFGQLIFEGTPEQVAASDVVRAAYLGVEA